MRTESPFIDCTDLISDRARLLEHGRQNGYFYFPGLLPVEPVLELRRQVLRVAERHELLNQTPIPMPVSVEKAFSSANRTAPRPSDVSTLNPEAPAFPTRFLTTSVSYVFWKSCSVSPFSSIPVTFVTPSFQENISIPRLRIRTSIRFAVHRIRGACGHHWETVMPSWADWRLHVDRTVAVPKERRCPFVELDRRQYGMGLESLQVRRCRHVSQLNDSSGS